MLTVDNGGFLSLLQDYGRYGYQRIGVTNGGPMDEHAFLWANKLLGNSHDSAMIEINLGQFAAVFDQPAMIAITGADMQPTLNGKPIGSWQTHFVEAGDRIEFHTASSGVRTYLAVQGGFIVDKHLGSVATVPREHIGGVRQDGGKLKQNDALEYTAGEKQESRQPRPRFVPDYDAPLSIGVILGYQVEAFSSERINRFFSSAYEITNNSNRMGYRLSGPEVSTDSLDGIISEGISLGAIQIPSDGQPIVLMRDRQTIGGYPKLGCLARQDISRLAQRGPGKEVTFHPVDIEVAEVECLAYQQFFNVR